MRAFFAHGLERPDTAFIAGATRFDSLADPGLFLGQLFVKERISSRLGFCLLLSQHQKFGVVGLPQGQMAAIELTDAVTDALQEPPVVGNEDDCALELTDLLLKPIDRGDIEMVGRLVQQQYVGLCHQCPRQCGTPSPSTRQSRQRVICL